MPAPGVTQPVGVAVLVFWVVVDRLVVVNFVVLLRVFVLVLTVCVREVLIRVRVLEAVDVERRVAVRVVVKTGFKAIKIPYVVELEGQVKLKRIARVAASTIEKLPLGTSFCKGVQKV